jgi:hypothetical protein
VAAAAVRAAILLRTTAAVALALALARPIFPCSYCADVVQKRLHHDVGHLIEAMRAGFNLVSQAQRRRRCPLAIRGAHVVQIQNTLLTPDVLDSAARVIIRHCDVTCDGSARRFSPTMPRCVLWT